MPDRKPGLAAIYADGRPEAGGGHVARCLALADALERNFEIEFRIPPGAEAARRKIEGRGYQTAVRDAQPSPMAAQLAIVDGYGFGEQFLAEVAGGSRLVAVFEDFGHSPEPADCYISPALPRPETGARLSGPRYALLDLAYAAEPVARPNSGPPRILVTHGLRDGSNATARTLDTIKGISAVSDVGEVTVLLGAEAPHLSAIEARCSSAGYSLVVGADDLLGFYDAADIVIGSGGVSLQERMARGRASVTVLAAPNQQPFAEWAAQKGATLLVGQTGPCAGESLDAAIERIVNDPDLRTRLGRTGRTLVDGRGAHRVADALGAMLGVHRGDTLRGNRVADQRSSML